MQITSPAPRGVWWDIFRADPEAIPYQSPDWLDSICEADGYYDSSRLFELSSGKQLILPTVRRRLAANLFAREASLPPAWGIGGLLAARQIEPGEIGAIVNELASHQSLRIRIRPNPRAGQA